MNSGSRTFNSVRNILFSIGNQLVTLMLGFINRYLFIKILGAEYLGINGLFSDVLMMLSLADLGLGSAITYSFYKPLAEKDEEKLIALTCFYKKVYRCIAVAVAIVGMILLPFIKDIVNVEQEIPHLHLYYLLFLVNSVTSYLFVYKSSLINADQRGYIISFYATLINIMKVILQIIALAFTHNYIIYLLIQIGCTLSNNLMIAFKSSKLYPFLNQKRDLDKKEKNEIFSNVKSVFLYKLSGILLNGTDNTLISVLVGTIWVGYYSNYNMIIGTISKFINTFFTSLNASLGNVVVNEGAEKRYGIFKVMQMVSFWLSGVCTVTLYFLINDFIELWIGKKFVFGQMTLIAILTNFYLATILPPIWSYREATGLYKKTKYIMCITAVVNIVLSIILGIKWGVGGIIIASAIAKLSTYFWYEPIILFKDYFKTSCKKYFLSQLVNVVHTLVICVIINMAIRIFSQVSWVNLILKGIICFVVSNGLYFVVYHKSKEFETILIKIKGLRRRQYECADCYQ